MDASTVSAFAAAFAALAAAAVGGITLYVGIRQTKADLLSAKAAMKEAQSAGRHRIAAFRQTWINTVMDTICDHHAILMTVPINAALPLADDRKLAALRTKLELLLNPDEPDNVALIKITDAIRQSQIVAIRETNAAKMVKLAHEILKKEWVRLKAELK